MFTRRQVGAASAGGVGSPGGGLNFPGIYIDGMYYLLTFVDANQSTTTQVPGANTIVFWRCVVLQDCQLDAGFIGIYANGAGGTRGIMGLYASSETTGLPTGDPLITSGELDISTGSAGYKQWTTTAVDVAAGIYWGAWVCNDGTYAYRSRSLAESFPGNVGVETGSDVAQNISKLSYIASHTYNATLPNAESLTIASSVTIKIPYARFRVQL